ncbi:hypothetical protein [Streptomyces sp. NPDC007100]|uniref:SLAC1 family transporter n=1 Tax=Streptomyces sp. NPDC007100 TaxID=3155602 RepID=UPI0033C8A903
MGHEAALRRKSYRTHAREGIERLPPGCFASVMAAGIVSGASTTIGAQTVARVLLGLGVLLHAALVGATVWRIAAHRSRVAQDAADPARAFGFFTFVAASDVLAADLAAGSWRPLAIGLLAGGALSCAALVLRTVVTVARARSARPDGSWFLLVDGPQSVVVAATAVQAGPMTAVAGACCWAAGVLAYVTITSLVWLRLRHHGVTQQAGRATGAGLWEEAGRTVAWAALAAWVLVGTAILGQWPRPWPAEHRAKPPHTPPG